MNDMAHNLVLRRRVAAWSDLAEKRASKFADDHRDLLPRRITKSQLSGLENVVSSSHRFADIQHFVRHQGEKAERVRRSDVGEYWGELGKALGDLRAEARRLLQQTGALNNAEMELDGLHRQLAGAFVQHLIAHSLYWTPETEDENVNSTR